MAESFRCKCGAGPFEGTKDLRVHILTSARVDGKGIHGWPATREFPAEMTGVPAPVFADVMSEAKDLLTLRTAELRSVTIPPAPPSNADDSHSDLDFEMEEMRAMLGMLRSELDALKQKVGATSAAWADAVPAPRPVDQEAVNLAQLDAMLGIDQPGPLDKKEADIIAAVEARLEPVAVAPRQAAVTPRKKGIAPGYYLIGAFLAIVGIAVLVITQMM